MAEFVYTDVKLYVGEYDLSGYHNQAEINSDVELLETTGFGDSSKTRVAGLVDASVKLQGYFESGTGLPNTVYAGNLAVADVPLAICPTGGAQGELAYIFKSVMGEYTPLTASMGDVLMFDVAANGSSGWPLAGGTVAETGTFAASNDGTGLNIGAVSATQHLYASLHVISGSGTLDVLIESDEDNTFLSPTTRLTFTQATGATSEMIRVAGAITDTWYRASWTVSGSFVAVIIIGIR